MMVAMRCACSRNRDSRKTRRTASAICVTLALAEILTPAPHTATRAAFCPFDARSQRHDDDWQAMGERLHRGSHDHRDTRQRMRGEAPRTVQEADRITATLFGAGPAGGSIAPYVARPRTGRVPRAATALANRLLLTLVGGSE